MNSKKNILKDKSLSFALDCIRTYKGLTETKKEYVLSKQFLRSSTSIGANIQEAYNAESKADFIHKFGIAQKECAETQYWLELLNCSNYIANTEFNTLNNNANELLKIIRSSILTARKNLKTK